MTGFSNVKPLIIPSTRCDEQDVNALVPMIVDLLSGKRGVCAADTDVVLLSESGKQVEPIAGFFSLNPEMLSVAPLSTYADNLTDNLSDVLPEAVGASCLVLKRLKRLSRHFDHALKDRSFEVRLIECVTVELGHFHV